MAHVVLDVCRKIMRPLNISAPSSLGLANISVFTCYYYYEHNSLPAYKSLITRKRQAFIMKLLIAEYVLLHQTAFAHHLPTKHGGEYAP